MSESGRVGAVEEGTGGVVLDCSSDLGALLHRHVRHRARGRPSRGAEQRDRRASAIYAFNVLSKNLKMIHFCTIHVYHSQKFYAFRRFWKCFSSK
jgi:hypothetical protein